jgi:hypothetical protein
LDPRRLSALAAKGIRANAQVEPAAFVLLLEQAPPHHSNRARIAESVESICALARRLPPSTGRFAPVT